MEPPAGQRRIEILMAVHHPCLEFFDKQVASIRAQTHQNWGLTLVVDGEHADLMQVLDGWRRLDPRIRCEMVPGHAGCCRTFEHGLAGLKGKDCLVALADQDDIWAPRKLELLEMVFRKSPDTLMAFCDSSVIDDQDRLISPSLHQCEKRVPAFGLASLMGRNSISGHAQLFRCELLDEAVPFPEGLCATGLNHDHWLSMVAAFKGRIQFLNEALVQHRLHGNNQIGPRIRQKNRERGGFGGWCRQNRHLKTALQIRHRFLGGLAGFPQASFGRAGMLAWGMRALLDRNPPAAAIYFRACCAVRA